MNNLKTIMEKTGQIFLIADDNPIVPGCTVSKAIYSDNGYDIRYFSIAQETDISAETYDYYKICFVNSGNIKIYTKEIISQEVNPGDIIKLYRGIPVGIKTDKGCIYTEISLPKEVNMNKIIKDGEVFNLTGLVPYQEGRIVNMDLINDSALKFVIMSFAKDTGLSEHSAPGEALIFALEGKGIIGYEGKEYKIKAGENFKFAKNAKHWVKSDGQFKMALLLTLN